MVRQGLCILICLVFPFVAAAQICGVTDLTEEFTPEETARLEGLVADVPFADGLIWAAEREGSRVVVVGTLHIPDPRFDPIVERLSPELAESDLLILEATREVEAEMATLAAERPELFFLTEGPTLIDMLSEAEWADLTDQLSERGIPGFVAAKFQPWYASLILAVPSCALTAMQAGEKGLDRRLEEVAEEAGVPVAGLEGPEAVLDVFAATPIEEQLRGLRLTLASQDPENANISTLVELYFEERTRASWEVARILIERDGVEGGAAMIDEINAKLLVGRNETWEGLLPGLVDGQDAVLAVGAAHLSGESGVLRALERAGYEVVPF